MILPDVNLLIYALDERSARHDPARTWWDAVLSSSERVGLCYPAILGFVRLTTNPRVFERPLRIGDAIEVVESWLDQPNVELLRPTESHWSILRELLLATGVGGNLTTDADLAAYAIEHALVLYSNDSDFARFPGLRWSNPLDRSRG